MNDFAPFFNASTISFSVNFNLTILFFKGTTSNTWWESKGPCSKKPLIFPALIIAISVPNSFLTASIIKNALGLGSKSLSLVGPVAVLTSPNCSGLPKICSNTPFNTLLRLKILDGVTLFWTFTITPLSSSHVIFKSPKYSPSLPAWVITTGSFDLEVKRFLPSSTPFNKSWVCPPTITSIPEVSFANLWSFVKPQWERTITLLIPCFLKSSTAVWTSFNVFSKSSTPICFLESLSLILSCKSGGAKPIIAYLCPFFSNTNDFSITPSSGFPLGICKFIPKLLNFAPFLLSASSGGFSSYSWFPSDVASTPSAFI